MSVRIAASTVVFTSTTGVLLIQIIDKKMKLLDQIFNKNLCCNTLLAGLRIYRT